MVSGVSASGGVQGQSPWPFPACAGGPTVSIVDTLTVTLLASLVDRLFGYSDWLFRRIGHPVSWIGAIIDRLDHRLNRPALLDRRRRLNGLLALLLLAGLPTLLAAAIQVGCVALLPRPLALAVLGLCAGTLSAQRSLLTHVRAVLHGLTREGLAGGRTAVAMIVGRDPASLDQAGVARAAIESLAENFSDGVVAPLLWCALLGLPGIVLYKAVNTADSMIGHLTPRHAAFGWASARLDDLINLPASRLAAIWIVLACLTGRTTRGGAAFRTVSADARRHRSPNAGWPEAAMAGGLGLRLAGPRRYGDRTVDDPWLGSGHAEATPADIRAALACIGRAWAIQTGLLAAALLAAVLSR